MNAVAHPWSVFVADETATLALAGRMATCLPVVQPFVLYLQGDLGTGKTTLTRGVLRALGEKGAVRSPTYGLMTEYDTPCGRVLHLDLYRLRAPAELASLGLADYLTDSRLWLIEWPEQAQGARLPPADAVVNLAVELAGRRLQVAPVSDAGRRWVGCLSLDSV
jgi:tRNA threonylcarbamoyladenosine biosynthesis protein TsaE